MYLLGIDIGTTATKVIVMESNGQVAAAVQEAVTLSSVQAGRAEEDAGQWWANVCRAIPRCLQQAGIDGRQVVAVGCSGMVPALVLLDGGGHVLRPSIQQNDARAVREIDEMRARTDAGDILRRTGSAITQQSVGPKLLWLLRHEAQVMRQAHSLMGSYEFIAHRLTGARYCERNWALESGLFDLQSGDWDDELLSLAGIGRSLLAPVRWPAEVVGEVTREAAALTGLMEGTPVAAGSADHIASAFSAGLKAPGDLLVKLGGSGDMLISLDEALVDERLYLDYHLIPGKFVMNGCMASSGSLIRWFREQFAAESDYAALDCEAESIAAGSDGLVLLPYFLGEKTPLQDPLARGTLVGLTLSHTRAHVFRAVLEGISYGFLHHLEVLAEHGLHPRVARCTNGGARSHLWKQVTADVLGIRLEEVAQHPGSSLGAAFCAGMGVGVFQEWSEIERFIQVSSVTEPDMEKHARYKKVYGLYREIYERLKDVYPRLG
jgi:xylulokinase